MAQKYAFLIDAERCIFCRACVVACKVENHVGSQWQRNDVIMLGPDQTKNPAMYSVFMNCQQCEMPACIAACPVENKAIEKRDDGVVLIIPDKCVGDEMCVYACPYGALRLTPRKNKYGYNVVDKCTYCVHKLERDPDAPGSNQPACVMTCPMKALEFGMRDELLARVKREGREILNIDKYGLGSSNIILKPRPVRVASALAEAGEKGITEWSFDLKDLRVGSSEELTPVG
jgi:Fe-S-cluster-containing dehydrogenase component